MAELLATKLRPPLLPPTRVPRPQLLERLDQGLTAGKLLTLVSAPAGFGKTTCIAGWVQTLDRPVAWLSLDPGDDDPGRFFTYLIAALQGVDSRLGREIGGLLRAGQLPSAGAIAATLINDTVALRTAFILVLDDLQMIQDTIILEVLRTLVENQPPVLHLVLLTREDPALPLARLRVRQRMTEIRASDLRFTISEADHFLNDVMALGLGSRQIAALEDKTEGWAAGLQLAALSLRGRERPSAFISQLRGSHRHILAYLTEEVLNQQPEEVRRFLLQTSILDRLSGGLCDAVTERDDSAALLEMLFAANLFLIPLDDEARWYRYHHLFRDLLRDLAAQLPAGDRVALHRRASRWYAKSSGDPTQRVDEREAFAGAAIDHALAAEDFGGAVTLIETHATKMLALWHMKAVRRWIQALPPEWSRKSPRTNLAFAWTHLMHMNRPQAKPYLERLVAHFADPGAADEDPALYAQWLALQAMLRNAMEQPTEGLALANQALEIVPAHQHYARCQVLLEIASAHQQMGDSVAAREAYEQVMRQGQASDNLVFELLAIAALSLIAVERGELFTAFEMTSRGVARMEVAELLPPISTALYGELGEVCYQWHQLDEAQRYFRRATEVSALSGFSDAEIYHAVILSRLHQIEGDLTASAGEIQRAVDLMRVEAPAAVRDEVTAQRIRVYLAQGQVTRAERLLDDITRSGPRQSTVRQAADSTNFAYHYRLLRIGKLRILLAKGRDRSDDESLTQGALHQGVAEATILMEVAAQRHYMPVVLEALLLRAQMYAAIGERERALADTRKALELAAPENAITLFVEHGPVIAGHLQALLVRGELGPVQPDYVRRILDAFGSGDERQANHEDADAGDTDAALIEALTDRELEVLDLMSQGLTYQQTADCLYVSLNTIRTHVKAIYGKLGVNNKIQAIEEAGRLHLL